MLDTSTIITTDRKFVAEATAFVEWYNTLFPDGTIPDYAEFHDTVNRETMTMREAWIARFFNEGINIHPEYALVDPDEVGPEIARAARDLMKVFPRASKSSPGPETLAQGIRDTSPWFTKPVDTFLKDVKGKAKFTKLKKTMFGDSGFAGRVAKFLSEGKGSGGSGGSTTFGAVISDESMSNMLKGFNDVPNDDLREAMWVGSFGSRGTATINIAINRKIAMGSSQSDQYWDPVNKLLVATETGTRKGLPPTRGVDPITESILDRRWQAAVDSGQTRLFPDEIQVKDISEGLKKYVYPKITDIDATRLGKPPAGITDLRKLVGSWMLKTMGQGDKVDQLLSHEGDALDEAARISRVGRMRYLTSEGDPKVFQDFLNRTVQRWGKILGVDSFDQIPAKTGLNATVTFENTVPYFDFDETDLNNGEDALSETQPQGRPKSEEELRLEEEEAKSASTKRISTNLQEAATADLATEETKAKTLEQRKANIEAEANMPEAPEQMPKVSDDTSTKVKTGASSLAKRAKRLGLGVLKTGAQMVPGLGLGLGAGTISQDVESATPGTEFRTGARSALGLVAEEATPIGILKPVVEPAVEAVGEAYQTEAEQQGLAEDLEGQVFRLFGESPFR